MATMTIEIPEGKEAKWVNGVLTLVDEQPKDITELIKTFEDACEWCKANRYAKLVGEYYFVATKCCHITKDILAYLKLRIITCALNEGWEPTFEEGEERYCAFIIYRGGTDSSIVNSIYYNESKMLFFKTPELAEYAAQQFKDIYMDFCKGKE